MKLSITALGAALMVASGASYAAPDALRIQDPTVLANGLAADQSTAAGAVTDAWVEQYRGTTGGQRLDEVQLHLHAMGPRERGAYAGAKAQCWIDAAHDERGHRNGWGFVEEATLEAASLVAALQAHAQAAAANPKLRTSSLLRPDLWERLAAAKSSPAWPACEPAQQIVACAEVGLMHAGHLAWTRAFGSAEERVAGIEAEIAGLPRTLQACAPPPPAPVAPVAPVLPPKLPLPAETLFEFDRSDIEGMLPEGRGKLDELAHLLGAGSGVTAIHADGYTDRLGSDRYNEVLSQRRAKRSSRICTNSV
jgi:outer membrane protein OmpA-like peptidoglycan-associated protein